MSLPAPINNIYSNTNEISSYVRSQDSCAHLPLLTKDSETIVSLVRLNPKKIWEPHKYHGKRKVDLNFNRYRIGDLYYQSTTGRAKPDVKLIKWKDSRFYVVPGENVRFGVCADNNIACTVFKIKCYHVKDDKVVSKFNEILFLSNIRNGNYIELNLKRMASEILDKKVKNFEDVSSELKEALADSKYTSTIGEEKLQKRLFKALKNKEHEKPASPEKRQAEDVEEIVGFISQVKRPKTNTQAQSAKNQDQSTTTASQNSNENSPFKIENESLILENQKLENEMKSYLYDGEGKLKENEKIQAYARSLSKENNELKSFDQENIQLRQEIEKGEQENKRLTDQISQCILERDRLKLIGAVALKVAEENMFFATENEKLWTSILEHARKENAEQIKNNNSL